MEAVETVERAIENIKQHIIHLADNIESRKQGGCAMPGTVGLLARKKEAEDNLTCLKELHRILSGERIEIKAEWGKDKVYQDHHYFDSYGTRTYAPQLIANEGDTVYVVPKEKPKETDEGSERDV